MPPQREFWRDVDLDPVPRTCTKKNAPPYRRRSVPARAPPHPPTTRTTGTHARARIGAVDPTGDASVVDAAAPRYARDAARVWTADESSTTRRARWFTATPRRASPPPPAGSSGIWTSARGPRRAAAPAPHVVDRPPPGVVDHFPPPPVPHDEALSPFGPLEPEHGASHTRTSTHARHPHTIRIILTRPIDKHLAFMPAHAPAQHCALTELAVSKRTPKATTHAPRKSVNYSDLVFKLFRRTRETRRARPPAPSSRTCTRSPASPVDSCTPAISCCGWRTEPRRRGTWTRRRLRSVRSTGWRPRRVARA